jgi:putative ABC transport system permease protein
MLGLDQDPIGKKINAFGNAGQSTTQSWTVIGIVDDFHFSSMKESILPLALFLDQNDGSVSFRFNTTNTREVVQSIEKVWKKLSPGQPFQYSFLDDDFEMMYRSEQRLALIFAVFAALAIIIACLGLFALTAFTAEQRTKEIGIRKALGASVGSIVLLLSKDLVKLVIIAFIIAAPVAWYVINQWLENYTYRTEIGILVYLMAGITIFIIALATMGYQSLKAATADPVESLRAE